LSNLLSTIFRNSIVNSEFCLVPNPQPDIANRFTHRALRILSLVRSSLILFHVHSEYTSSSSLQPVTSQNSFIVLFMRVRLSLRRSFSVINPLSPSHLTCCVQRLLSTIGLVTAYVRQDGNAQAFQQRPKATVPLSFINALMFCVIVML